MKNGILTSLAVLLALTLCGWAQTNSDNNNRDDENSKAVKRMDDAAADLDRLTNAPDNGIPDTVLAKARYVSIIPSLVKGGFSSAPSMDAESLLAAWTTNGPRQRSSLSPAVAGRADRWRGR